MADEADSKSVVGNHVWVQVPPPAFVMRRDPLAGGVLMTAGQDLPGSREDSLGRQATTFCFK